MTQKATTRVVERKVQTTCLATLAKVKLNSCIHPVTRSRSESSSSEFTLCTLISSRHHWMVSITPMNSSRLMLIPFESFVQGRLRVTPKCRLLTLMNIHELRRRKLSRGDLLTDVNAVEAPQRFSNGLKFSSSNIMHITTKNIHHNGIITPISQ